MQEVCKLLHINKTRTTAYHPQSDGVVERLNRTLLSMLAATVQEHPGDWDKKLRLVCMAHNTWGCPYGRDDNTGVCQKSAANVGESLFES